jgi:hypothetical protein
MHNHGNELFCLNPWHYERTEPSLLAHQASVVADHSCDVRLRFYQGKKQPEFVCPFCQKTRSPFAKAGRMTAFMAKEVPPSAKKTSATELVAVVGANDELVVKEEVVDPLAATEKSVAELEKELGDMIGTDEVKQEMMGEPEKEKEKMQQKEDEDPFGRLEIVVDRAKDEGDGGLEEDEDDEEEDVITEETGALTAGDSDWTPVASSFTGKRKRVLEEASVEIVDGNYSSGGSSTSSSPVFGSTGSKSQRPRSKPATTSKFRCWKCLQWFVQDELKGHNCLPKLLDTNSYFCCHFCGFCTMDSSIAGR